MAFDDHKIGYAVSFCRRDVLDIGCVEHDPGPSRARTKPVIDPDLLDEGVSAWRDRGFNVIAAVAQVFFLG